MVWTSAQVEAGKIRKQLWWWWQGEGDLVAGAFLTGCFGLWCYVLLSLVLAVDSVMCMAVFHGPGSRGAWWSFGPRVTAHVADRNSKALEVNRHGGGASVKCERGHQIDSFRWWWPIKQRQEQLSPKIYFPSVWVCSNRVWSSWFCTSSVWVYLSPTIYWLTVA